MTPKRFFFVLLGALVVLAGLGGYGYYYAVTRLTAARTELSAALTEQVASQAQIDELSRLKTQYNRDIVPVLDKINAALPRTKNQTEILAQLQTVAIASGLALSNVTLPNAAGLPGETSQTVKSGAVLALPISFQLKGTYPQLQAFLVKVENLNRFTNVTTLAITHADKSAEVTYAMTVNAYIKP